MGNHNTIGFLTNTGSEPTKTRKASKSAFNVPLRKKMHCRKQFLRTASEYSANTLRILCEYSAIAW